MGLRCGGIAVVNNLYEGPIGFDVNILSDLQ
jgi:hypothetical protein